MNTLPASLDRPVSAKVIDVIYLDASRGDGSAENPERMILLYYSLDGRLLACCDPDIDFPDDDECDA